MMKRYDQLLQVVRECDYRVLEAPGCGCQAAQARCLMARGGAHWDRHEVNPRDCLECTKRKEENGRVVVEDTKNPERINGNSHIGYFSASSYRSHGTASGG